MYANNPYYLTLTGIDFGRVAQWIRRPTSNRKIVGSSPIVVAVCLARRCYR